MLNLIQGNPRGWLLLYMRRNHVPSQAPTGTGYIYVLAITGATAYVKVGCTAQPNSRFVALRTEAHRVGGTVTQAWLSPAHPTYKSSEAETLSACRAMSPSSTPRSEYFPDLDFAVARRAAVRAVLGFRDSARVSTMTQAAGIHEPLPSFVHRSQQPSSPWDPHGQLRQYFAQGSQRTRFLRRHDAPIIPAHRASDPLSAFVELSGPRARVIDLVSRQPAVTSPC
ncbi:hypothetical protein [Streptomyces purpurascens]|uniref:hypothetical protein n=1 Tax=Streptomyces purpurascens TaxID=1924 RepID=UPI003C2C43E3